MNDDNIFSGGFVPGDDEDGTKAEPSFAETNGDLHTDGADTVSESAAAEPSVPYVSAAPFPPVNEDIHIDASNVEEFLARFQPADTSAASNEGEKPSTPADSTFIPVGSYSAQPRQGAAAEPQQTANTAFNPYASAPQFQPSQPNFSQQSYQVPPYSQQQYTAPGAPTPAPKKGKGKIVAFVLVALCLVIAGFFIFGGGNNNTVQPQTTGEPQTTAEKAPEVNVNTPPESSVVQTENVNSVWVAKKVRPSVVGVMTYQDGQLSGEGSGVIWAEDSTGEYTYVVTCAHVIDESGATFGILLLDGRRFEAEMVATDARTDIGVLKVKATGLPKAEFGDSSALEIGEPIYAIGNPGGSEFFGSFTDGVVSGIDRSISATYTMTCVQHSAAINPGNSGGALVNTSGQVIGINSSKIASTDYEGMGFAVPMSIVKPVVDALIEYRYVPNRPKLGIEYASVGTYQLYSMVVSIKGLPQGSLVIAGISSDSSLANTEAQVGDLIIGVNGKPMDNSSVLLDLIDTGAVGDTLTLTLCRIEKRTYKTTTFDVTITLVEDKGNTVQQEETTKAPEGGYNYGGAGSFEDFFNDYFGFGW